MDGAATGMKGKGGVGARRTTDGRCCFHCCCCYAFLDCFWLPNKNARYTYASHRFDIALRSMDADGWMPRVPFRSMASTPTSFHTNGRQRRHYVASRSRISFQWMIHHDIFWSVKYILADSAALFACAFLLSLLPSYRSLTTELFPRSKIRQS